MSSRSESSPENDDPVLDDDVAVAIVQRYVPTAKRVTAVDESGRKGRAYFIDDEVVLKTHRPVRLRTRVVEEFETSLEKEALFLEHMAREPGIRTPRLLGYGRESGVEYVCMTRVLGVTLRRTGFSPLQRERALRELGVTLRRIHGLPQAPLANSSLFPQVGSGPAMRVHLEGLFARIVEAMSELPQEWQMRLPADQVAATALAALPDTTERVALHSNPAGEHVFADPQTGALTGLIDFGDAYIGHPAFDLRPWRELGDRNAVLSGYVQETGPVDGSFLATWRVALILGELAAVLRMREPPARAEERLRLLLRDIEEGSEP